MGDSPRKTAAICQLLDEADRPSATGSGAVGRHPWADDQGRICPRTAGTWLANMILTAGGSASTAFACAQLLSDEIERHPAKFGTNPALDRDPINPNRPGAIRNGAPFDCPQCGKRHQVGFCRPNSSVEARQK